MSVANIFLCIKAILWLFFKSYYMFLAGLSQFYNMRTWDQLKDYWKILEIPEEDFKPGDWVGPNNFFHSNFWYVAFTVGFMYVTGNMSTYFEASQILLGRVNDSAELMIPKENLAPFKLTDRRKYSNFHEDWNISFEEAYNGINYDEWFTAKNEINVEVAEEDPYALEDFWFMEDDNSSETTYYVSYAALVFGRNKPWFGITYQNKYFGDYFDYSFLSVISAKDFAVYVTDHMEKRIPMEYLYYYRSPFDQDMYEYSMEAEQVYAAMFDPMGFGDCN